MYYLFHGDCLDQLKKLADNSIDAIVTDPPYGLSDHKPSDVMDCLAAWLDGKPYQTKKRGFMGNTWDSWVPGPEVWRECFRVLKSGGHLLAFAGSRTHDLMSIALRLAGFECRDTVMWIYGCLDEQTELVTKDGVKPYHKATVGEHILCYDTETGQYDYQPIQEIVEYDYSDTAYRLIGDFGEQVVSRNHRVIVERSGKEVFQFAETLPVEVCVPFLEDLPELQKAISGTRPISGHSQKGLQQGVCGRNDFKGDGWKGHKTAMVRVVPFHYTGKVWCVRVPTGAFVAVRNGLAFPTGNSGFPKSVDVSKQIDKMAGAEREVVGVAGRSGSIRNSMAGDFAGGEYMATAPATDAACQWEGWGTALKPAYEPVLLFRKPLSGTVAENVLKHGTGGINIDGCRVGASDGENRARPPRTTGGNTGNWKDWSGGESEHHASGRWPANFIHSGEDDAIAGLGEASRYFYCAKASKRDRDEGLEGFDLSKTTFASGTGLRNNGDGTPRNQAPSNKNSHPTVKPTDLMRYLCRLVTPPNGVILDPFMGSGSTGKAAMLEGFNFVGIEREAEYLKIAEARISQVATPSLQLVFDL